LADPLSTIKQHIVNTISLKEAEEAKKKEANNIFKKPSKKKGGMNIE